MRARLLLTGATVLAATACGAASPQTHTPTLLLKPCDVQSIPAGCGTLFVPEDRARPDGRKIGLHVVLIPARHQPAGRDVFTYLAGGPGVAATEETYEIATTWAPVRDHHDILLVDQRGTGRSHPLECRAPKARVSSAAARRAYFRSCLAALDGDVTQYGTRAAMDDLDAVRRALGYEQLDIYGVSYGATAAQVYLRRHRSSVRTLVLDGATELGASLYAHFAQNAERSLTQLERRCRTDEACTRAFPHWRATFDRLVRRWNRSPVRLGRRVSMTGDDLAGVVQTMLLDPEDAAAIPLVVAHAARRDFGPLEKQGRPGEFTRELMFWSIWCNEPWVGLSAHGPWGTVFDGYAAGTLRGYRAVCAVLPKRAEPADAWQAARSTVPLLALVGGADPQDPAANLFNLREHFPNARAIVVPSYGHAVAAYGCLAGLASIFIDAASSSRLDLRCVRAIKPVPFALSP
jgi:pimeloyl-ACP methyl ester carboxylesterase